MIEIEFPKQEENAFDAYVIFKELISADGCEMSKKIMDVCSNEGSAEFSLKLEATNYEGYDSGYTRSFIDQVGLHGRVYEKDGVKVKLYWKKVKLIVEE